MRAANPFITHVIGSLRESEVGWQTVDTIKLHFRFRCPGAVNEVKFGGQITKVLATHVVERGKPRATAWPRDSEPAGAITMRDRRRSNSGRSEKISSGIPKRTAEPGHEPINSAASANVRFDVAPAVIRNR
jgi:hypothetical protein